jgi:hypothetical protein
MDFFSLTLPLKMTSFENQNGPVFLILQLCAQRHRQAFDVLLTHSRMYSFVLCALSPSPSPGSLCAESINGPLS